MFSLPKNSLESYENCILLLQSPLSSESGAVLVKSKIHLILHYIPLLLLILSLVILYSVGQVLMTQNCDGVKVCFISFSLLGNMV